MKKLLILLIFALVFTTACVSTNAVLLDSNNVLPPLPPSDVIIYQTIEDIPFKYKKIAIISARGSSIYTDEAGMINAMREKAGKLGANGLVLQEIKDASAGAKVAGAIFGVGTNRTGNCTAIYLFKGQALDNQ
jgi:hypothetical protein